ncbi:MAG: tRNA (adenosine(37)-N6)-threonylcarbamoyltransferase complex ATPase subunit type 1 TsaE [Anaeroplasmataceae bacterium]|nr:tRNA (adenosine(37)-N6)-threonylcarbamoyltransferase complex ATPase subunit type 1 TsaE [Anaeroplasmataceae bacterium]
MLKSYKTNSAEETIELGKKIGNLLNPSDVLLLTGDLSAGKTTLTKGIGISLGVKKIINSPTFTIVKEYKGKCPLYHLDLYRLDGLNNDFDLEDFIEGDGVCVIEWPYQVEEILPKEYLEINLKRISEFERSIEVKANGSRYEEVLKEL